MSLIIRLDRAGSDKLAGNWRRFSGKQAVFHGVVLETCAGSALSGLRCLFSGANALEPT